MKYLISGALLAAVVATASFSSAQAHMYRHHHGWRHHGWYNWYGPYAWQSPHVPNDFVANRLNRAVLGEIGLRGSLGLDRVALNPQPLPP